MHCWGLTKMQVYVPARVSTAHHGYCGAACAVPESSMNPEIMTAATIVRMFASVMSVRQHSIVPGAETYGGTAVGSFNPNELILTSAWHRHNCHAMSCGDRRADQQPDACCARMEHAQQSRLVSAHYGASWRQTEDRKCEHQHGRHGVIIGMRSTSG